MPPDPIARRAEVAIMWHEAMADYEAAGFTHDEAFKLIESQVQEYWSAVYVKNIIGADDV